MAETTVKKTDDDIKRSAHLKKLVFGWMELNKPKILNECKRLADEAYPRKRRGEPVELPEELKNMS